MSRLFKVLWAGAIILMMAAVAAWFADRPGTVTIEWQGYRAETSMGVLVALMVIVVLALLALDYLGRASARGAGDVGRYMAAWRSRKVQDALVRGLIATASGDAGTARRALNQAQRGKVDRRLLLLLRAETARLRRDGPAAEAAYTAMLDVPETEGLGLAGLMGLAREQGDRERLDALVERALGSGVRARALFEALLQAEVRAGRWSAARRVLGDAVRRSVVTRQEAARPRAVLLAAEAATRRGAGHDPEALGLARRALRYAPGFVPAALLAADLQRGFGRKVRAAAIVEAIWPLAPHPALGALYMSLVESEPADKRWQHAKKLVELNREHPESRLLLAREALAEGKLSAAENTLMPLLAPAPTARVCEMMADIARTGGIRTGGQSVEGWLSRAAQAPRDGLWRCRACARETETWEPVCAQCHGFDSQDWVVGPPPDHGREQLSTEEVAEEADAISAEVAAVLPAARRHPGNGRRRRAPPGGVRPEGVRQAAAGADPPGGFTPPRPPDDPGPQDDDDRRW